MCLTAFHSSRCFCPCHHFRELLRQIPRRAALATPQAALSSRYGSSCTDCSTCSRPTQTLSFRAKRGICISPIISPPLLREVVPTRILFFDQRNPFRTSPCLNLLLPRNRVANVAKLLHVNQAANPITRCKSRYQPPLVFHHSPKKVVRYSRVQILRPARHNVHTKSTIRPPRHLKCRFLVA